MTSLQSISVDVRPVGDARIALYRLHQADGDALAQWAQMVQDVIRAWPRTQTYRALYDLTQPGVALALTMLLNKSDQPILNIGITSDGLRAVHHLVAQRPHFRARVAYVYSRSHSGFVSTVFAKSDTRRRTSLKVAYNVFDDHEKAVDWLRETPAETT